jgi:tRNA-specific 2-thiouridylase
MRRRKRVLAAMSGGIDSSLAAAMLKRKGFEVIGATMKLWPKEECGENYSAKACCSLEGIEDARHIASKLNFPHYVFDFHNEFKDKVIDYFCREYSEGFTPNPCIVCNQKIKFDLLLKKAAKLGCEYIATGHYAKVGHDKLRNRYFVREGKDKKKDQSYFLSFLSQATLAKTIFPLENMTKAESRNLAKKLDLRIHDKKSSQEVCFVRGHYSEYIKKGTGGDARQGDILNTKGEIMGRHKGIHFYTIGQRKGLGIPYKEPLYVIKIDKNKNAITVGTKSEVAKKNFVVKNPCWGFADGIKKPIRAMCKIRYTHKKAGAIVEKLNSGRLKVSFYKPQVVPTPGQAAVFYRGDKVLGCGWINSVLE